MLSIPSLRYTHVSFSADNRFLACSTPNDEICIWDCRLGKEVRRICSLGSPARQHGFSPDGTRFLAGLSNGSFLMWEMAKSPAQGTLDGAKAGIAWADLAGAASVAFKARGALASSPKSALPLLKTHLKAVHGADPAELRRLLADLDANEFATRDRARKRLEALGDRAAGALEQALRGKPSIEAYRRIERLLSRLRPPALSAEALQQLRGIAVLEDIGNAECRRLLETLGGGLPEARVTQEAKAALLRLQER